MKHFYLIPNDTKEGARLLSEKTAALIQKNGGTAVIAENRDWDPPEGTEAVLTFGGDGTIIRAAGKLADRGIPFMGINLGTLGYLAEAEEQEYEEAVLSLLSGHFYQEERMMLEGEVIRESQVIHQGLGVNDIVLSGAGRTRSVRFDVMIGQEHLKAYHADGVILATPTGSTAYNLSAGGPIVMPSAKMILLTPINPHTLLSRSIIVSDDREICLRLFGKEDTEAELFFDGYCFRGLHIGDEIRIRKSALSVKLLKLRKESFIEILSKKLERE